MDAEQILMLCFLFTITCISAQTVQLYPSPRASAVLHGTLRLTCSNTGTGNTSAATWRRNDTTVGTVRTQNSCAAFGQITNVTMYAVECIGSQTVHLTMNNISLEQHRDMWSCTLTIDNVPFPSSITTVFVKVHVSSVMLSTPSSSSDTVTVFENSLVNFKCETSPSRPAPEIFWYIEDVAISQIVSQKPDVGSEGYNATVGSLAYNPPRASNDKNVSCRSRDDDGNTIWSDRKILLNVTYKPTSGPQIQGFTNKDVYYAINNKQQTLTCTVTGGNPLAVLSWSCFQGMEEDSSSGQIVSKKLVWNASSNGTCTCTSTHMGLAERVVLNVGILSPPTSPMFLFHSKIVGASTTVRIIRDSTAPIKCTATSFPAPNKYTWKYDGHSTTLIQAASLYPSKITANGPYWCHVGNRMSPSQGQDENGNSSAYINILRLYPPTEPVLSYGNESGVTIPGSFKVIKGDNFSMHCSSTGKPSPLYQWTGDRRLIQSQVITVSAITLDKAYICKAMNTMDPTFLSPVRTSSSSVVSVYVLFPPTNMTKTYHYSQSGSISVTTLLDVINGKTFSVACAATAVPPPALSWHGPRNSSFEVLRFSSIQEHHDGTYKCTARNIMNRTFGAQKVGISITSLQIRVLYAPTVIPFNVDPVVEESTLSVECQTRPGNPAKTTYSWKRMLNSSWRDIPASSINGSQLLITNINRNDAGNYNCTALNVMKPTAENEKIGSSSHTFFLSVLYKTSISSFIEVDHPTKQEVTVAENSSINLECEVDSNPGSTVSILKDDVTEKTEGNTKLISYRRSKVACNTAGIYKCVGYNRYNTESKPFKNVRLFVTCSPRLQSPEDFVSNITSALNDKAQLKITVVAYPVPEESEYVWSKWNGDDWETLIHDKDVKINSSGLDSSLIFQSVKVSDYQKYRVNVKNGFGQLQQEFFLNPYGKPNPPENVNVMDGSLRETSAKISWTPGFDGGPKQTFVVQYKKQGESSWLEVTKKDERTESMNVSLTGLDDRTTYTFRMFSKNIKGNSSFTDILTFQTLEKTETRSATALIVGATGGSLVFIILLIGVVVLFVRRSSFKKGKSKSSSEGNDRKPVYEEENDYGMQDNPMYVSAGPRQSSSKAEESSSGGAAVYSTVNKRTKAKDNDNDNEYAVVNKTNKAKAKQGKKEKEKSKPGFFKDKKGKKLVQEGDIYENAPSKDVKAVPAKDETIYENPESSLSTQKKNVNKDGLIYADLTFNDQPKGQKKLVIHGLDSMTEYVQVDFTKKADPLPDSDDENIPPKN